MSRIVSSSMSEPKLTRRSLRLSPLVWLLSLGACTSVLGIEDLHDGPRPGSGGDGSGATETTGATGNIGGKTFGGTTGNPAGAGNDAGAGNESTSGGKNTTGGTLGASGAGNDAGAGGQAPASSTVHGHVIDFWGHPVPSIPVQIGDTLASTDDSGDFVFDNVPATYDVSMVYDHTDTEQSDAWVYQGLTRRDPTLQMYAGAVKRFGDVDINFLPKPTLTATQTSWVDVGGVDGSTLYYDVGVDGYQGTYAEWYGPATVQQTAHGLKWQKDVNDLPTSYLGYDSALVALAETGTAKITLDFSKGKVDSSNITGTITPTGAGSRENEVFLAFTSNARIQLVDDTSGPNAISYNVPSIPNSGVTVAAEQGSSYSGWAVAHADGLAPGAKPVLKVPGIVTLLTPAGGAANVTDTTKFTFQSPAGNTGPFVVEFYSQAQDLGYQTIYVVTAQKQLTLPTIIGGGFSMYPMGVYKWAVATHGNYPSVDAMASKDGFLDEFSRDEDTADGPRNVTGEFTDSVPRGFTLKQ